MESNQVSLTRTMLNIATPDQAISFSRGEILTGTVNEVRNDGLVMMMLKGRLIEAATEVAVKAGQQLFLMVDDFKDGKTYLRVLNPERMEKAENASLSANLRNMGIPVQEDTVMMARKLLQHNLPVTPAYLNEMAKGIKLLAGANPNTLEVTAWALSRNLPMNERVLSALLQFTDPKSELSGLIKTLAQNLTQLYRAETSQATPAERPAAAFTPLPAANTPVSGNVAENQAGGRAPAPAANTTPAQAMPLDQTMIANQRAETAVAGNQPPAGGAESGRITLENIQNLVARNLPPNGESQARPVSQLPLAERSGPINNVIVQEDGNDNVPSARSGITEAARSLSQTAAVANITENTVAAGGAAVRTGPELVMEQPGRNESSAPTPASTDKLSAQLLGLRNEGELIRHIGLLRSLIDIMQIPVDDRPAVVGERLQTLFQSEKELIRGLILLEDILKATDTGTKLSLVTELLTRIEGMEKELAGQRIFNNLSRLPEANLNSFYFSFPVKIEDDYHLCQLRINHETAPRLLQDQDSIKFIVSLDTAKIGMVLFHVDWNRNRTLAVQGVVEREEIKTHLNRNIDKLNDGLAALGYKVTNLGIRVARDDEELDNLKPQIREVPMKFRPFSIDVRI